MPIAYPRVLIVDRPALDRTVLFDLNDDTMPIQTSSKTGLEPTDWSFGQVDITGDPDAIGVDYALRELGFRQSISGTLNAAMARQGQMTRALLAQRFWVEFQLSAETTPVWWHAYRTPPGEVKLDKIFFDGLPVDRIEMTGSIDVDAFSYAARIALPTQTVGNDPAGSLPSVGYNLPTVRGDAPSRLRVSLSSDATSTRAQSYLVSAIASARPNPVVRVSIGTGDGFTAGAGTSAPHSDMSAVGGSARDVQVPAFDAMGARLSGQIPAAAALRGRYAVYLRYSASSSSGALGAVSVRGQLFLPAPGGAVQMAKPLSAVQTLRSFTVAGAVTNYSYAPLGIVDLGENVPADMVAPTKRAVTVALGGGPVAATVVLDEILLVPISGPDVASVTTLTVSAVGTAPKSGSPLVIDGDTEMVMLGGTVDPSSYSVSASGGFPTVDPAAAYNTLLVLPIEDLGGSGDSAGTTRVTALGARTTVAVSYQPRSAWLGDGS